MQMGLVIYDILLFVGLTCVIQLLIHISFKVSQFFKNRELYSE